MGFVKTGLTRILPVMTAVAIYASPVLAAKMNSNSNIVCALVDVLACVEGIGCEKGTAKLYDLPDLVIYDGQTKSLRAAYEKGTESSSPVKNFEASGNHVVMQGVENSRGWDIAINTDTGKMRGAGVGDDISFLVFGSCAAL